MGLALLLLEHLRAAYQFTDIGIKMTQIIYIVENGKKRKATAEELLQRDKDRAEYEEAQRLIEAAEKEKAEKKESATNKLKALGLTDSEVEALLG
jgi:hypothetical protein